MATKKKLLQAAAGSAGGAVLDVDEVFRTYLYDGTGSAQTITNGIDLSGEGGLVWLKRRDFTRHHLLYDTARGATESLFSSLDSAEVTRSTGLTAFNSNGFTLGSQDAENENNGDFVSWTFRKASKFFDVVTYTGTGSAQNISHNLGSDVGFLIVKRTDSTSTWRCWHRGLPSGNDVIHINETSAYETSSAIWNGTAPTSTQFSVGTNNNVNASGGTYVAYLFAHNNSDGDFGPDADQDIIKCGSYTGTGSSGHLIDLGFEPQWLLIKNTDAAESWIIQDNMRSMTDTDYAWLYANGSNNEAEGSLSGGASAARPTGFEINLTGANINASGNTYIYMAIRRGPLAAPEDATDVFESYTASPSDADYPAFVSGFVTDAAMRLYKDGGIAHWMSSRLQGEKYLETSNTAAEQATSSAKWDYQTGWYDALGNTSFLSHMWKRAPSFFDVVAYTGTGSNRTVSHNLGAVPEMIWVKGRNWAEDWNVYHSALGNEAYLKLNTTNQVVTSTNNRWNSTSPTASVFSLGTTDGVNKNSYNYIAYLFATVAGVSKVGSYTGNGSSQNIDCGFSNGARFVLIKRTDASQDWGLFDTARGIVAGNDSLLSINATSAETTGYDVVDPYSGGFAVGPELLGIVNDNGGNYIFYAIA